MDEKIINSQVRASLEFGHKISDESRVKKPMDVFGTYKGKAIYIETKYLSSPKSFNFNRLETHQIASLLKIEKENILGAFVPLLLIAVNYGRGRVRVYYYKDMAEIDRRKREKNNILKKEFDSSTNYIIIQKGLLDFDKILNEQNELLEGGK